jgi:hypothetical protein
MHDHPILGATQRRATDFIQMIIAETTGLEEPTFAGARARLSQTSATCVIQKVDINCQYIDNSEVMARPDPDAGACFTTRDIQSICVDNHTRAEVQPTVRIGEITCRPTSIDLEDFEKMGTWSHAEKNGSFAHR